LTKTNKNTYLFSIDLEDVRDGIPDGYKYNERVPYLTEQYLKLLKKHGFNCTFFIVGIVAERYPELIKFIYEQGNEIACHSYDHKKSLEQHTPITFKDDLQRNIEVILRTGVKEIYGYRAPTFSLTEKTKWVYDILEELGFKYSSSVLPAKNPLYGWKEFGTEPALCGNILEIPMSITNSKILNIPFGGGIYFRVLPRIITNYYFTKYTKSGKPVLGYFHPYDIDTEQEKFMHPGIKNSRFYNYLMYYNRKNVFNKIVRILQSGFQVIRYINYYYQFVKKNKD